VLASLGHKDPAKRGRVFVSSEGKDWTELPVPTPSQGVYEFPLAGAVSASQRLYVRITGPGFGGGVIVGGLALCA